MNTRSPKSHPLDISNPLPVSTVSYVRGGLGTATVGLVTGRCGELLVLRLSPVAYHEFD